MDRLKSIVPNSLTCCNLLCGCVATLFALRAGYGEALAAIVAGAVFDFLDGFAARLLGVSSPLGRELDSLADDVTFGVTPAAVLFSLLSGAPMPLAGPAAQAAVPYAAFLMAAFSALRLAKFNIDTRQAHSFIGMPTPANTLFWGALAVGCGDWLATWPYAVPALLAAMLLSCYLMVSGIPMFALKFTSFGWQANRLRYSFLLASAALLVLLGWAGLSAVVVLYVLLSVLSARRPRHAGQNNRPA